MPARTEIQDAIGHLRAELLNARDLLDHNKMTHEEYCERVEIIHKCAVRMLSAVQLALVLED